MSQANPDGRLTAEPSSAGVRHPCALVLGEWAAGAADAGPYADPEKQQAKLSPSICFISKLRIGLNPRAPSLRSRRRVLKLGASEQRGRRRMWWAVTPAAAVLRSLQDPRRLSAHLRAD